jgi:iron complex outermembrane recepter protein
VDAVAGALDTARQAAEAATGQPRSDRGFAEGNDPRQTFGLRGSVDLGRGLELDGYLRAISRLPQPLVPGYAELDLRAGWWLTPDLEVSIVGRNLLHPSHPEWGAALPRRVEFERSVYARLTVLF